MKYYLIVSSIIIFIFVSIIAFVEMKKSPIKVGIIHSQSGTMAKSEKPVLKATLLAIDQINKNGGLMGRMVEAVVIDGKSQAEGFHQGLQKLIDQEITTIFGGWTSSSRKAMLALLEKNDALLFYPLQYEGFESSPNIVYLGLSANQQIIPTLNYAVEQFGKKVFLVGSDYIYPHISNKFIRSITSYTNIEVVGEEYVKLGEDNLQNLVQKIKKTKPSFIINTLNGESNVAFFRDLQKEQISLEETAVFSFSLEENGIADIIKSLGLEAVRGTYATWGYFNTIDTKRNRELKDLFQDDTILSDPAYSAYMGIQLWAEVVRKHKSFDTAIIKRNIQKQSIRGIGGVLYISPKNNHTRRNVCIAKVDKNGLFNIVWNSESPQRPKPFPEYIDRDEISKYDKALYQKWGEQYEAPIGGKNE